MALYSGTCKDAVLRLAYMPNTRGGWIDTEHGLMFRRAESERVTNKRQPPARLPDRLLAHAPRAALGDHVPNPFGPGARLAPASPGQGNPCPPVAGRWQLLVTREQLPVIAQGIYRRFRKAADYPVQRFPRDGAQQLP
ncbi:hypothetical protein [Gemmobacter denitrificans]|uniref:Uncharacterized protein n=1 Tax=Gemmobacter denitrificans TaxID=3123040 RepID=A0ABU8BQ45_9RHOB